jgi:hypothetical protein
LNEPMNPTTPGSGPLPPEEGQDSWQEVIGGFPRHLTTELINEEDAQRGRRERIAGWVLAMALTLFALAWPQERLLSLTFGESLRGVPALGLAWRQVAGEFAAAAGLSTELLALIFSAILYGACLPLVLSIGRRVGASFGIALATGLVVLLAPSAWLAGTTPGVASLALLMGMLLIYELWREGPLRTKRITQYWVLAALADPGMAWAFPAILTAVGSRTLEQGGGTQAARRLLLAGPMLFFGVCAIVADWISPAGEWMSTLSDLLTRGYLTELSGNWSSPLSWIPSSLVSLGLTIFGVGGLLLLNRNEAEQAPPRWLMAWALLPCVILGLAGSAHTNYPVLWMLPPALIGCLDQVMRQDQDKSGWVAGLGLFVQGGILAGVLTVIGQLDPQAEWRRQASDSLNPSDWVATEIWEHNYILNSRWGVSSSLVREDSLLAGLADRAREASQLGQRVVLDQTQESPLLSELEVLLDGLQGLVILRPPGTPLHE